MEPSHVDRAGRIMTAALSRRRALQAVAGGAALGLLGDLRRVRAATVNAELMSRYDLAAAVLRPSDLPDGDRLGVGSGITYLGGSGAVEKGTGESSRSASATCSIRHTPESPG